MLPFPKSRGIHSLAAEKRKISYSKCVTIIKIIIVQLSDVQLSNLYVDRHLNSTKYNLWNESSNKRSIWIYVNATLCKRDSTSDFILYLYLKWILRNSIGLKKITENLSWIQLNLVVFNITFRKLGLIANRVLNTELRVCRFSPHMRRLAPVYVYRK